jgi:Na+-transporting methylmalonyl-CoA/oxaloacetate decarboxylase gamma subunit
MENLGWGLQMTVVGMGLVFGLLAALWGLLSLVLRLDAPPAVTAPAEGTPSAASQAGIDPDLVAAITVAVLTHKTVRRRQAAPAMRSYWPGSLLYASRWVATGRARQNRSWRRGKP